MLASVDVTNVKIETERLILRPWRETDLADFYEYASVDGVGQMAGWTPHQSMEESKAILASFVQHKKTLALELKENGKVIGSVGLEEMDPDPVTGELYGREIGYVLSKSYWGRGLMPETVRAVTDYCFRVLGLDYLTCGHFIQNEQSRRVIEKTGFSYFGDSLYETRYDTVEACRNYIQFNPCKER